MRLRLRELRQRKGWSQDTVSKLAGMSKSFYSEVETGRKAANSRRLQRLAEVFGVAVFELIDDTSIDAELLEHLQMLRELNDEDRRAVIRHALSLASRSRPRG